MVDKEKIKRKVARLLKENKSSLNWNSNTPERAYETYIFSLCKKAVEDVGGTAVLRGIVSGPNPKPVVFRGAPGLMSSIAQDFCYIECKLNGKEFEIHLDVEYEGKSGAKHEMDISFFDHKTAEQIRKSNRLPKTNQLLMIFECKLYDYSMPDVSLARGFAGLVQDCSSNKLNAFVANKGNLNLRRYFSNKKTLEPFVDLDPDDKDAECMFLNYVKHTLIKWATH